jgi:HD-GYP domain-containing protein (c-di-GMP phosphodiesterase class II)
MAHDDAVSELAGAAGTQFDPRAVAALPGRLVRSRAAALSAPAS